MMMEYDIFKGDVGDGLVSSKFVRNESEYDFRSSTLKLLKEPRFSSNYLYEQPVARLIRLINEFKNVVQSSSSRAVFRT